VWAPTLVLGTCPKSAQIWPKSRSTFATLSRTTCSIKCPHGGHAPGAPPPLLTFCTACPSAPCYSISERPSSPLPLAHSASPFSPSALSLSLPATLLAMTTDAPPPSSPLRPPCYCCCIMAATAAASWLLLHRCRCSFATVRH
jgi:hypothetical protein